MTDKKLTDNEIIKALECCSNYNGCDKCDFEPKDNKKKTIGCCLETMKNALDLITRLQARVEKSEKVEYFADKTIATLQAENKDLAETIHNLTIEKDALFDKADELKAEVERLKTEFDFAKSENEELKSAINGFRGYEEEIKSEAVKECIEKVKKEISEALKSNYKARAEREQKIPIYTETEFLSYCSGKIDCLRGIDDFLDNLVKEMVGENND